MDATEQDRQSAYEDGQLAYLNGQTQNDCPFDGRDPESKMLNGDWIDGWLDAETKYEESL